MKDHNTDMMGGDPLLNEEEDGEVAPLKSTLTSIRVMPHYHETSTQKLEMDLHSGRSHNMFTSIIHMGRSYETSLSCGVPPGRPPDSDLVKYVSCIDAPFIDPRREGALEHHASALRVWGNYKEKEIIFPLTSLSILSTHTALRKFVARGKNDIIMK